jgi:uncharacterized protein YjiS (DUF1127 family)
MADMTDTSFATPRPRDILRGLARAFWTAAEAHGTRAGRRRQIEALHAKSDAELAEMGIARERIAHHVFKDLYYI